MSWSTLQSLIARLPLPPSRSNPGQPDISEGALREYEMLCMDPKDWEQLDLMYGADGQPFISFDESGKLTINDPLLAQWDADARAVARGGGR